MPVTAVTFKKCIHDNQTEIQLCHPRRRPASPARVWRSLDPGPSFQPSSLRPSLSPASPLGGGREAAGSRDFGYYSYRPAQLGGVAWVAVVSEGSRGAWLCAWGGGDTVTRELSGGKQGSCKLKESARRLFSAAVPTQMQLVGSDQGAGQPQGWRERRRSWCAGRPASRKLRTGRWRPSGAGAQRALTYAQLDGVGVVGPAQQEADEHHRDPVQHPPAPPPDAARARGRHLPAAATCPALPPPPPPADLAPGWAGRARNPRRDGPWGGGRLRCGHCRRRGAKSPSHSREPAPRTPGFSAPRRRRQLRSEDREEEAEEEAEEEMEAPLRPRPEPRLATSLAAPWGGFPGTQLSPERSSPQGSRWERMLTLAHPPPLVTLGSG
jgi:hypothetical protein